MPRKPNLPDPNHGSYVVPLGTSSAIPTLARGLSATLLVRRTGGIYLFDGGEGTQLQFLRSGLSYGKLRRVFVTHLHLDHYGGLLGLISRMCLGSSDQFLHVYGPRGLGRIMDVHLRHTLRHAPLDFHLTELAPDFEGMVCEDEDGVITAAPLNHVIPALGYRYEEHPRPGTFDGAAADRLGVPHGPERAHLVRGETITLSDGRTITPADLVGPERPGAVFAYCTDSRPCAGSVRLAREAHVLMHEATFFDSDARVARERGHSTLDEAIQVAREAGAHTLLATHFSTRYDERTLRAMIDAARPSDLRLLLARDLQPVKLLAD